MRLFQSTRPHGARQVPESEHAGFLVFQSTRPHGARHGRRGDTVGDGRFNPRARMGRDSTRMSAMLHDAMFQSTRPHGARLSGTISSPIR